MNAKEGAIVAMGIVKQIGGLPSAAKVLNAAVGTMQGEEMDRSGPRRGGRPLNSYDPVVVNDPVANEEDLWSSHIAVVA